MKVRFKKLVAVDYSDVRLNEIVSRSYYHNQVLQVAAVEENVNGYYNFHMENGDMLIGVPKNVVEVIGA